MGRIQIGSVSASASSLPCLAFEHLSQVDDSEWLCPPRVNTETSEILGSNSGMYIYVLYAKNREWDVLPNGNLESPLRDSQWKFLNSIPLQAIPQASLLTGIQRVSEKAVPWVIHNVVGGRLQILPQARGSLPFYPSSYAA